MLALRGLCEQRSGQNAEPEELLNVIKACSLQSVGPAWCGKSQPPDGSLLPVVGAGHAWLHPDWSAPSREDRLKAAIDTLAAVGICALMARSVRFFAFIFFIRLRTWTFTVLSHMFNS
jgi:hypothetical protein